MSGKITIDDGEILKELDIQLIKTANLKGVPDVGSKIVFDKDRENVLDRLRKKVIKINS